MEPIKIGVTGTRFKNKITTRQKLHLDVIFLSAYGIHTAGIANVELRHGDCTGVDEYCHELAIKYGLYTEAYPPIKDTYRAYTKNNVVHPPEDYLIRNKKIVYKSEILVGVPETEEQVIRSGTWSTIRYAQATKKPAFVILPSGNIKHNEYVFGLSNTYKRILGIKEEE